MSRSLDLANTSVVLDARAGGRGVSNSLAREVAQEAGVGLVERARAVQYIDHARAAEPSLALLVGSRVGRGEELADDGGADDGSGDVLEHVALCEDHGAGVDLEGVACRRGHVVVHKVQERATSDLGGAAAKVVDVVALEGDGVVGAGEVEVPVVLLITGRGPGRDAVDLRVRNRDAL